LGSFKDTDVEHIVAASEAHDSGLCAASDETKRKFANDLLNLTLATPKSIGIKRQTRIWRIGNRKIISAGSLSEWWPSRKKYGLTIDLREAAAMKELAARC